MRGKCSNAHDFNTHVQKRFGNRTWTGLGRCRLCGSFLDPQLEHGEICSSAEATRGHYACVHAVLGELKLADPGITTEPRGLTGTQARLADIFTTAASQDAVRPRMCVWSLLTQQQLEETQRKQPFDGKLTHCRHEIPDLRNQGIHFRPLVWTADGRPHPAVTRILQYVADIASRRNGQQISAKSLQLESRHDTGSPTEPFSMSRKAPRRYPRQSSQSLGSNPPPPLLRKRYGV